MDTNTVIAIAAATGVAGFFAGVCWQAWRQAKADEQQRREESDRREILDVKKDIHDLRETLERHLRVGAGHQ